jgi:PAS domain S-box-containing protein
MTFIPEIVKLLFIEDDEKITRNTTKVLKLGNHIQFDVINKKTLKDGMEFLQKECNDIGSCSVDVILLDVTLPNSYGVSTYKSIYKVCNFLPVVIISDHEDIACECVKKGAQDFLLKPVNEGVLSRSLKYAVERRKIQKNLEESERQYRNLVEATNAGIYEIDFVQNRFTYVNDVMCRLTGWSKKELMAMGPSDMLTEKSIKDWIIRWEALQRGEYIEKTFEYEAKIKDGSTIWTLVTAEFKEDENGVVFGARVVAIDITERKMAKIKEQKIFNELENRIRQWKEELTRDNLLLKDKIQSVSMGISSITNIAEVS